MKSIVMVCLALLVIVFCSAPSYAACTLTNPDYGPFTKVTKYKPGTLKVLQTWECVGSIDAYRFTGNGICFGNFLDNEYNSQVICISGEYKIECPVGQYCLEQW